MPTVKVERERECVWRSCSSVASRVEKDAFSTLLVALGAKRVAAVIGCGERPHCIAGVCGVHTLVVASSIGRSWPAGDELFISGWRD